MIKILIIEDQVIIANFIETILLDNNYINVKYHLCYQSFGLI